MPNPLRPSTLRRQLRDLRESVIGSTDVKEHSVFGHVRPLPVDPRLSLDFAEIGERGSYFFLSHCSRYVKRQVETLQIKSATFARRHLTIDVQLPPDQELGERIRRGEYEYWIPITSLTKRPRSNIDLRDDNGCAVPLLTRAENNRISIAAVLAGAEELLGSAPSPFLTVLLEETVRCDGMQGNISMEMAKEALRLEKVSFSDEKAAAFADTLRILSGNYAMWVRFCGRPGDRKVVKFHYDVELDRQGLLRQRPRKHRYLIFGKQTGTKYDLELREQGDGNPYSPIRRLLARIASSTGLGAINVGIESTYIAGSDTYHLQVESPPGVETRDIDLLADLEGDPDSSSNSWKRDHGAHLYVGGARGVEDGISPVLLTLRIGRRGFMTLSWLSVLLSATILWFFDLTASKVRFEHPEAIAAVLLFGPALLAALVVRPGEHPVTTKLFSGIRVLVALNGILVVAAAASVVGVRPEGWSAEHSWFVYAICASVSAAAVSLSWVFSWDITYGLVKFLRWQLSTEKKYERLSAWLLGLAAPLLLAASTGPFGLPSAVYVAPLAGLAVACGFVSAGYAGLSRSAAPAAIAVTLTFFASVAELTALILHLTSAWAWAEHWRPMAAVPLVGLLLLALSALRAETRKRARSSAALGSLRSRVEDIRAGLPTSPNMAWLGQTPTGIQMRRQARENATGVPDLLAPSAYLEVESPEKLKEAAADIHRKFEEAFTREEAQKASGNGNANGKAALNEDERREEAREREEERADRLDLKFVCLDHL